MPRSDYRFAWRKRVRYAEIDAQAVVYNSRYLEYFDLALTEYWREAGLYDHYRGDLTTLLEGVAGEDPARRAQIPLLTDTLMAALDGLWLDWMRRRDAAGVQNGLEGCMVLIRTLLP